METKKAYIITGPTSGIGYATALELAKRGTVILVGRNRDKLNGVQKAIEARGNKAVTVVYSKRENCGSANFSTSTSDCRIA